MANKRWGSKSGIGGYPVQMVSTDTKADEIQIQAHSTNTAPVYVGLGDCVTIKGTNDETDGYPLAASQSVTLKIRNPNEIYVVSSEEGQRVNFLILSKSLGKLTTASLLRYPPVLDNLKVLLTPWSGFFKDAAGSYPASDGDVVHRWSNAAVGQAANYFAQSTFSKQPTLTNDGSGQGGLGYITTDGTDDFLDSIQNEAVFNTGTEISVLLGARIVKPGANSVDVVIDSGTAVGSNDYGFNVVNEQRDSIPSDESINFGYDAGGGGNFREWGKLNSYPSTTPIIWAAGHTGTATDKLFLNGTDQAPYDYRFSGTVTFIPASHAIRLGTDVEEGFPSQIDFYFFLYYTDLLSDGDFLAVSNWINSWMEVY